VEDSSLPEPIFPDGCMEIVLNLAEPFQRIHRDGRIEPVAGHRCEVSSGGRTSLPGFPQQEAAGRILALETIEGRLKQQLEQAVWEARSDWERIAGLEALLLRRLRPRPEPRIEAALDSMLTNPTEPSLAAVVAESGWSERQFRRRFQEAGGIGPKLFSRVLRFHRTTSSHSPARPPRPYASRTHPLADEFRGAAILAASLLPAGLS
jgi:AraC-like DNA-binding protein